MLGEIVLARPVRLTVIAYGVACAALAVAALFTFGTYTRRTTVEGVIVPDAGLVKIYPKQAGVVLRRAVADGQHVTRGAVLYAISTDLQSEVAGQTQAALIDQARERKRLLQQERDKTRVLQQHERNTLETKALSLRAELERLDAQLVSQSERTTIAADTVVRYRNLRAQDSASINEVEQRQTDLLDQQLKLHGLQRERASVSQALKASSNEYAGLALKHENQLSEISRAVIDVDRMLVESEARREFVITAPEDGIVTAVTGEPGQTLDPSHPAASVIPDGSQWQAHLYVPNGAVGFVRAGDPIRVRFQAYPFQKFGQYGARVASIARVALSAGELLMGAAPEAGAGTRGATFYRVTATLDAQTVMAYGKSQPLQAGMSLQADILQERRRLFEWVLEPLYSLTGKL